MKKIGMAMIAIMVLSICFTSASAFKLMPSHINVDIDGDLSEKTEPVKEIAIINERDVLVNATVRVEKPQSPNEGYEAIPDVSWVIVRPDHFAIPAGNTAYADIYVNIPDTEENYGKKWQCLIMARQEPNQGERVVIELSGRMNITTASQSQQQMGLLMEEFGIIGVAIVAIAAMIFISNHRKTRKFLGIVATISMFLMGIAFIPVSSSGDMGEVAITVTVGGNQSPHAVMSYPSAIYVNESMAFNGSQSYDSDGTITNYTWNINGTIKYDAVVNHTFTETGDYWVNLTVTDNDGATDFSNTTISVTTYTPSSDWGEDTDIWLIAGIIIVLLCLLGIVFYRNGRR